MVDSDPNFLGAILKKFERDNSIVHVLSMTTEPASNAGDNYGSIILRANLKVVLGSGKIANKRVILKKGLVDVREDMAADMSGAFNLEGFVYDKLLASYNDLLKEYSLPYGKFWPDCIFTSKDLIVFDDLTTCGFRLGKRQTGLDPEHAKLVFINFARLHSLSWVAIADGSVFAKTLPPYLMTDMGLGEKFFPVTLKSLADVMRDFWGPEWSEAENKIRSMIHDIMPTLKKLYNEPHKLSVVCHGDCWVNNMMFKYDAHGKPIEQKFFDFQLGHCNSYAWDLAYFLHSSLNPKFIASCYDSLIEIYSEEFADNLARFGRNPSSAPSVQDIHEELVRLRPFSLAVATSILPVTTNPSNIKISLDEMTNPNSTKLRELYQDKDLEKTIQAMFLYFTKLGIL